MKTRTIFIETIIFILYLIVFYGCDDESSNINDPDTIYGSGKIVTQARDVEECSGVTIKNVGNIYLTLADSQSIRIEADDNILDKVITQKDNQSLIVGLEEGSYSDITLKIYVSLKSIYNLSIEGAGNIITENPIDCDTLTTSINGAGNLTLTGNGDYFNCSVNGAGNVLAKDFVAKKCKAFVNGAGNLTIYVTEELDASVNGVGTISYFGNPPKVKTSITGLGQIIKK